MTLINWLGVIYMAVIVIIGIVLFVYYRKKAKDLDGLNGIIVEEDNEEYLDEQA